MPRHRIPSTLINEDAFGHSFDTDSLNIHVQLPPNSTSWLRSSPRRPVPSSTTAPCPVTKDAGMVGTLSVE